MRHLRTLIAGLLIASTLAVQAEPTQSGEPLDYQLHTTLEGRSLTFPVSVRRDSHGEVSLLAVDLLALGIRLPTQAALMHAGDAYISLSTLSPLIIDVDHERRRLRLRASAAPPPELPAKPDKRRIPLPDGGHELNEISLRLIVDGVDSQRRVIVLQQRDRYLIDPRVLAELGLPLPALRPLFIDGRDYLVLDELWPYPVAVDPVWKLLSLRQGDQTPAANLALQETWVEVNVNESREPRLVRALVGEGQQFFMDAATLAIYQLKIPSQSRQYQDVLYYPVSSISGLTSVFDEQRQALSLYATSQAFRESERDIGGFEPVTPDYGRPGAIANYAVFGSSSEGGESVSSQVELGAFWGRGFLSSYHLHRDSSDGTSDNLRLDTTLRLDWPERMTTLQLGDGLSEAGAWGRSVRFGGVQWGRNFATQPGFVPFPTELVVGETAVPSTVDIFINGARRSSQPVSPGPFTLNEVPVVTGAGEMRIVTRDLLGRETVVTRPFYASEQLLRPGLHEYSYEAGVLREAYVQRSNDYGDGFVSATHRYGFSRLFTGELRAETSADVSALGFGANFLWPAVAEFNFAAAASRAEDQRSGVLYALGLRRQARSFSFGANASWRSADWRQLGDGERLPDALESRAFVSVGLGRVGSLALSHVRRDQRHEADVEFATVQYSLGLWRAAQLRFSYFEPLADDLERSASISLSMSLGGARSAQLSSRRQDGDGTIRAQMQRNLPAGSGLGYRLAAESGAVENYEAGLSARGRAGQANLEVGQVGDFREYRASLDGGLAWLGGRPYLSQRLNQGFAVVEVPGLEGVDIYRDNQRLATTNKAGKALVPNLRDYQENRVRIEDAELPMNIEVAALEKIVIPAHRHGVHLKFDIEHSQWVGFQVVDSAGGFLDTGTQLLDETTGSRHVVGDGGRVYLESGAGSHAFQAWPRSGHCRFQLSIPKSAGIMPDLGERICR